MTEFQGFPKLARLSREVIITEKIDGTNAQVFISEEGSIFAGSRTRWITPQDDNFGFAKWVEENKNELLKLGAGRHFGEWWGSGIQRGYDLPKGEKRFSLFNVSRWSDDSLRPKCCHVVPVLYQGLFDTVKVNECLETLKSRGSMASIGFMRPEGVVVFHIAGNIGFKKTIEKDGVPKSKQ
jgi:hypothetical protein